MKGLLHFNYQEVECDVDDGYEAMRQKASDAFSLNKNSIELDFVDDEGDRIILASDSDLEIMTAISDGNINVRGTKVIRSSEPSKQPSSESEG